MSAVEQMKQPQATSKAKQNRVTLYGRIESRRLYQKKHYTVLKTAAADEFTTPSSFEIRSNEPLGEVGDLLTVQCDFSGFVRPKTYTDQSTGERRQYNDAKVFFDAVE